jgi:hypothetical protein
VRIKQVPGTQEIDGGESVVMRNREYFSLVAAGVLLVMPELFFVIRFTEPFPNWVWLAAILGYPVLYFVVLNWFVNSGDGPQSGSDGSEPVP